MEHFVIRKIRIDIIITLLQHDSITSNSFLLQMINIQTLWVDGIIVLDTEGKTDCEYSMDETLTSEITEYLQKDIIMDFTEYEERSYSERFAREDGSYIDIAACPSRLSSLLATTIPSSATIIVPSF